MALIQGPVQHTAYQFLLVPDYAVFHRITAHFAAKRSQHRRIHVPYLAGRRRFFHFHQFVARGNYTDAYPLIHRHLPYAHCSQRSYMARRKHLSPFQHRLSRVYVVAPVYDVHTRRGRLGYSYRTVAVVLRQFLHHRRICAFRQRTACWYRRTAARTKRLGAAAHFYAGLLFQYGRYGIRTAKCVRRSHCISVNSRTVKARHILRRVYVHTENPPRRLIQRYVFLSGYTAEAASYHFKRFIRGFYGQHLICVSRLYLF